MENFTNIVLDTFFGVIENGERKPSLMNQILLAIIICILIAIFVEFIRYLINKYVNSLKGTPWIIPDIRDGKKELVLSQNPIDSNYLPLRRSINEDQGIEFSYMMWLYVEDWNYKKGEKKHVFHKGSNNEYLQAPGVYFHETSNKLIVNMNTYEELYDTIEIDNIPVGKWIHVSILQKGMALDVYINGLLKKHLVLSGIPKQNFGDLWLCKNNGFNGFISKMRYFDYAVTFGEIEHAVNSGPSLHLPSKVMEIPPYLSSNWWLN